MKKILFCVFYILLCSCNNSNNRVIDVWLHNKKGLPHHLPQIIECFIEQFNIPKERNIYISEIYYTVDTKPFFLGMDINKHLTVVIFDYGSNIPKVVQNRVLYSTRWNGYTLFYEVDKDREMSISNNLVWKIIESSKKKEFIPPMIVDYTETQFVYNKEKNVIELSDFKSESCKGRLNDN